MKTKRIPVSVFAVLVPAFVLAACGSGSPPRDPLFQQMLDALSPGLPGNITGLGLVAADFSGMPTAGYEGYEYDSDGNRLSLFWTDQGTSTYNSLKSHFASKLGAKTGYTAADEISVGQLTIQVCTYTSGGDKECYISYYRQSITASGITIPAGTIVVSFGEE